MFLPLAVASIPIAFIDGTIPIHDLIYKKILVFLLLIPVIKFLFYKNIKDEALKPYNFTLCLVIGGQH